MWPDRENDTNPHNPPGNNSDPPEQLAPQVIVSSEFMPTPETGSASSSENTIISGEKKPKKFKIPLRIICALIICMLVLISGVIVVINHKNSNSSNTSIAKLSPQMQKRITAGLPPNATTDNLKIDYININLPTPTSLADYALTSNGHYIYDATSNGPNTCLGDQPCFEIMSSLIYDGKTVYQGTGLDQANQPDHDIMLSANGLHYGYVVYNIAAGDIDASTASIYIDGKIVKNVGLNNTESNSVQLDAISNNGTDYVYNGTDAVYKDGEKTADASADLESSNTSALLNTGDRTALFDSNADNYVTLSQGNDLNSLQYVYSNKTYSDSFNGGVYGLGVSQNGAHYFLVGNNYSESSKHKAVPNPNYGQQDECSHGGCTTDENKTFSITTKDEYTTNDQLIVDGHTVYATDKTTVNALTDKSFDPSYPDASQFLKAGVTNNGDYYFISTGDSPFLMIDNKYQYPLPSKDFASNSSEQTPETATELVSVNNNLTHYIVGNSGTDYWKIDGKATSLSGDIYNVEIDNNTLYIYRFSS